MSIDITMPQLSDTMSEGTVVRWLKKEGDKVKAGDVIAEVETDKATMEMEAFDSGTLASIAASEGQKVKVGARIAVLAGPGEDPAQVKQQAASAQGGGAGGARPAAAPQEVAAAGTEADRKMEPQRIQSRREATQTAAGRSSRSVAESATAAVMDRAGDGAGRMRISPLARRIAEERGVDPAKIRGSGPGGRITQRDVEEFLAASPQARNEAVAAPAPPAAPPTRAGAPPAPSAPLPQRVASGQKQVVTLNKMRATIAQRLQQSKQTIPHFYETVEIDVEELAAVRQRINQQIESEGVRLSIGDFIAKAVATALLRHPALNAHFNGNDITRFGDVNLGMAVALPEGLIVPVLRNINQMGLKEVRQRSADLVERARAQRLKQDEMTGATFTVSNLGTYGVKEFSAIINPPEVGILAVSAAEKRPAIRGGAVVPRMLMNVTLSADHRVVDGAAAAEFLRTLKQLLEEPGMMLV